MSGHQTVVLDTSVLAELMKPQPDFDVLRWTNAQPIGTLAVTAVSLAELTYAMMRMSDLSRTIDLRAALNEFVHDDLANRVLPFDDLAADYFAEFAWRREQAGTPIDVAEAQVAATCRAHGVTLATKDPAPYLELGVSAVDPWTAPAPVLVEVPVVVSSPELDRNGKPIPPRRPGAARGGVGPSRPPRQRRPRRNTKGASRPTPATPASKRAPVKVNRPSSDAEVRRVAADRLRRHVANVAAAAQAPDGSSPGKPTDRELAARRVAAARRAKAAAAPREEPAARGSGPGRRGARLLGPLVDAEGRPVERTPEGRIRPRAADAPSSPDERRGPPTPEDPKRSQGATGGGPSPDR